MNIEQIKELIQDFDKSGLSKLKLSKDDIALELEKGGSAPVAVAAPVAAPSVAAPQAPAQETTTSSFNGEAILSPMVGTFYTAPSPDSPPFVKKGDIVKKGQVIGILEAMKIMNELEAEFDCKILDLLVSDGQPIEYDMPLFEIEKI
jgi:acetyl-CoA carboxylase biotin carboxyl carrier protein